MKRVLSLLMLLALVASLFVFSPAALATGDDPAETEKPAATEAPAETEKPEASEEPLKELTKLTTTLDRTPVVLLDVSESHGTVSSKNASFVSLTWYDAGGNALPASSKFDYQTYRMEIRARADDGYIFSQNLAGYLNNSAASVTVSSDGKYATVTREYEALVFAPRIIKHPGEETINEGSFVSYVSTAAYATGLTWEFISPDGQTVFDCSEMNKTFRDSRCTNDGVEKIVIYNVPMEMNGWNVRAVFTGAQGTVTRSNPVTVKVNMDPNKERPEMTPAPEESPEASEEPAPDTSPEPTPAPTPEPTPTPAPTAAPAETEAPQNGHEHRFSQLWTADETSHWHECDCGERSEEAPHEFKWKTLEVQNGVATQEGVCRVCAYRETKQVTVNDAHIINKIPMTYVFIGALGLMAVMIAAESVKRSRRR